MLGRVFGDRAEIRLGAFGRRLLVPWHAVRELPEGGFQVKSGLDVVHLPPGSVRRLQLSEATELLRSALRDPFSAAQLRSMVSRLGRGGTDEGQKLAGLADLMANGSYLLVDLGVPRGPSLSGFSGTPRTREPETFVEPAGPEQPKSALRVRVVLDDEVALAGASIRLTAPTGDRSEHTANAYGEASVFELTTGGTGLAVVAGVSSARFRSTGEARAESELMFDFPFAVELSANVSTGPMQTIVLRRPEVERIDGEGLDFAPDSSLLIPLSDHLSPTPALATALAGLAGEASRRLWIVGHASSDGATAANEALALRRAQCVRHLLADAREAWVDLAAKHGAPADVQRQLRYLARAHDWPTEPTRLDGVVDAKVEAAVSQFQAHYNAVFAGSIAVDGVIGVETLGALFDVQRAELRLQLAALDLEQTAPRWFGASGVAAAGSRVGAHPAIPESGSQAGQRRVDLLLISDPRSWREQHGIEALYNIARFHSLPLSPRTQASCDLVVQVVDHYGRVLRGEPYTVRTEQEVRVGTSDDQGMVIEHNLRGAHARLECGEAVIVIDDPYHQTAKKRYQRVPPTDIGDDDDWGAPDWALPNVDDGDDGDDDDDDDELVDDDLDGDG